MNEFFRGLDPKLVRKLMTLGICGVVLLVAANIFSGPSAPATSALASHSPSVGPSKPTSSAHTQSSSGDKLLQFEHIVAQDVTDSLSPITGAGTVHVSVTLNDSPQLKYEINQTISQQTTKSTDSHGGTQTTTHTSTSNQLATGNQSGPVLKSEVGPSVTGVLVVASGARSQTIRKELTQAVETLLGVPAYKVLVLP